jgi:hypothetical protein
MLVCVRTSIDIPDPLLRRARHLARRRGTTLREVFLEGLRSVVESERGGRAPYRVEDCSFGGDGLAEGLSWSDTARLRDLVYEGRGA